MSMSGAFKPFFISFYNLTRELCAATTVLNLKRNGSVLTDHSSTARKNTRRADVQSFVLTPANEGNLRRKETSLEILHAAMELNKTQFDQLIVSAVYISHYSMTI
jgi:hypothetical protein